MLRCFFLLLRGRSNSGMNQEEPGVDRPGIDLIVCVAPYMEGLP